MRKCMSQPKMKTRENNYNNYFVNPELRYKKRTVDPKTMKENIENQQYLYNTLHGDKLDDWRHPFEKQQKIEEEKKQKLSDKDIERLVGFKQYI